MKIRLNFEKFINEGKDFTIEYGGLYIIFSPMVCFDKYIYNAQSIIDVDPPIRILPFFDEKYSNYTVIDYLGIHANINEEEKNDLLNFLELSHNILIKELPEATERLIVQILIGLSNTDFILFNSAGITYDNLEKIFFYVMKIMDEKPYKTVLCIEETNSLIKYENIKVEKITKDKLTNLISWFLKQGKQNPNPNVFKLR